MHLKYYPPQQEINIYTRSLAGAYTERDKALLRYTSPQDEEDRKQAVRMLVNYEGLIQLYTKDVLRGERGVFDLKQIPSGFSLEGCYEKIRRVANSVIADSNTLQETLTKETRSAAFASDERYRLFVKKQLDRIKGLKIKQLSYEMDRLTLYQNHLDLSQEQKLMVAMSKGYVAGKLRLLNNI